MGAKKIWNCRNTPETTCLRKRAVRLNFIQMFTGIFERFVDFPATALRPTSPLLMASRNVLADKLDAISGNTIPVCTYLAGVFCSSQKTSCYASNFTHSRRLHQVDPRTYSFRDNYVIYRAQRVASRGSNQLWKLRASCVVISLQLWNSTFQICGSNALFMMQHACYVTHRDRQINGNVMDARKIQAESQILHRHIV